MTRTIKRGPIPEPVRSTTSSKPRATLAAQIEAWWDAVLAGRVDAPHPIHGAAVKVHLNGARLKLTGTLESREDRDELVRQARDRIGRGITAVKAKDLEVAAQKEKPGILDQVLIAAFTNSEVAELARTYVLQHSRVDPKRHEVIGPDEAEKLNTLVPEGFVPDARKALEAGEAVLLLEVDETEAFRVRELLEEDTQSIWTLAAPPTVSKAA